MIKTMMEGLLVCGLAVNASAMNAQNEDTMQRASAYPVAMDKPATDFFEGVLQGNGGMGIWFENFALPAVINECLMQSYDGVIRLFPNWNSASDVSFRTLRAKGAFLVREELKDGVTQQVEICSECGGVCRMWNPWGGRKVSVSGVPDKKIEYKGDMLVFPTKAGEEYVIRAL